jgi:hypothetical protein
MTALHHLLLVRVFEKSAMDFLKMNNTTSQWSFNSFDEDDDDDDDD